MKNRLLALGLFALAGCAAAQMQLPPTLAAGEELEFAGIGGWSDGRFTADEFSGEYHRSAVRLSYLAPLVENRGGSRFTLVDADGAKVEGLCRMRERSVDLGIVEVTTRPMAYRCDLASAGEHRPGWLELQEYNGPGAAATRYERRGEMTLHGETLTIRSVHHLVGTSMQTLTPIGYQFEQGGRIVGAVELNGRPLLSVVPGASPELRDVLVAGALALAVFWDPANTDT